MKVCVHVRLTSRWKAIKPYWIYMPFGCVAGEMEGGAEGERETRGGRREEDRVWGGGGGGG